MFVEQVAADALHKALFAYNTQRASTISPTDRFVHYTSARAAEQIIRGDAQGKRSLWLRNSRAMNDFTEVQWGQYCLEKATSDWRLHDRFKRILDAIHPSVYLRLAGALNQERSQLGENAYLLSLALHDRLECHTGKLSMWRAYGGVGNVCLVFNTAPFLNYQTAYETVLSPVLYGGPYEFATEFEGVLYRLEQQLTLLRGVDPDYVLLMLKRALDFAVLSTKHRGFHEETEWRVIHQHSSERPDPPFINDPSDATKRVYQIPLENRPEANLRGAELSELLDRIIVGPVTDLSAIEAAKAPYIEMLRNAGVANAADRVLFCEIPLKRC